MNSRNTFLKFDQKTVLADIFSLQFIEITKCQKISKVYFLTVDGDSEIQFAAYSFSFIDLFLQHCINITNLPKNMYQDKQYDDKPFDFRVFRSCN